ncbi:Lipopolysaccharide biosynthesis protein RffA [Enhygromyxa salina]|uniref:Lipopolysaccharide biosynthesis protein RffA n=1 Tax=Enhygromyxa salina TaxID=215803 RepID=A0A0C2A7B0_9BACT|nr:aminotransferase class I/II-fold pyridoxal phosphate-dependent enzyme [Enhygromyxa salina]KIG19358.1 Lipopolysaccharide biosynthesis protein RffA [Enhygromyxa salina]
MVSARRATSERIYLSPPDVGPAEREALLSAFDSGWIAPLGPQVDAFERAIALRVGRSDAAATNSGTAALHLALRLLGVGPGDEVWLSTLTFIATATPVTWLGAEPVFMDSEARTWNLDPELLAHALDCAATLGRLPKAVIVVDIYGQCADYDPIVAACQRHGVALVEDAAESLGASYNGRPAGSFGKLALVSFNGNKIATCGGGGMLVGDDPQLIARARWLASQAREDAAHYQHELCGYNYRLSNVLAGIGVAQAARLEELVDRRRANFAHYAAALGDLPGITFMPEPPGHRATRWLTVVLVDHDRFGVGPEQLRLALERAGIESRPLWKPLHLQPLFARNRCIGGPFTEQLFERGLCLPSGSTLRREDQERVIAVIRACHRAANPMVFVPSEACA